MLAVTGVEPGHTDSAADSFLDAAIRVAASFCPNAALSVRNVSQQKTSHHRWYAGWPSFTATKTPRHVAQIFPPAV